MACLHAEDDGGVDRTHRLVVALGRDVQVHRYATARTLRLVQKARLDMVGDDKRVRVDVDDHRFRFPQ